MNFKGFKYLLILLVFIGPLQSCDDDTETNTLVGKWQLVEQYMDPGDGSGDYLPVNSNKTLEFFSNGWINTNGDFCDMSTEATSTGNATYSVNDQIIYPKNCSGNEFKIIYELKDDILILYYPCIEGCGQKFKKIK